MTSETCSKGSYSPDIGGIHLYILCIIYEIQEVLSVVLQNLGIIEVNMASTG